MQRIIFNDIKRDTMLIEFLILFQIVAFLLLVGCFWKGGLVTWTLAIILFGFLAFSFFNIEDSKTLVSTSNSTIVTDYQTNTIYEYQKIIETHKDLSLVWLNVGLAGFCLVFFYIEAFRQNE